MRNDIALKRYLKKGLSLMHLRVMLLFNIVKNYYYQYAIDNLHNSAALFKAAYNYEKKVLTHGITQLGSRGIPSCIH